MHLISLKRKEKKKLRARCFQLLEAYEIVTGMRTKRESDLKQTQHAILHYQQRYVQAKRQCHSIRAQMHRGSLMMERLFRSDTWVTASEHERLNSESQQWVQRLCAVRAKLNQYQQYIAKLHRQAEDHVVRLIGLDRAMVTLTQELHLIRHTHTSPMKPSQDPHRHSYHHKQYHHPNPKVFPSTFSVKSDL
jgi:predicted  nucleic acid-binding Zn-ribbon protein